MNLTLPVIEFDKVKLCGTDGQTIVEDVSFTINNGEKVILHGISGSGKSTILLAVLGKYKPYSGRILIDGEELTNHTVRSLHTRFGYISQNPLTAGGTVRDALLLPFTFRANRHILPSPGKVIDILTLLNFSESVLKKEVSVLSGGEKQRLSIARMLLLDRKVLLIDEPASSQDEENELALLNLFKSMNNTIVLITHNSQWRKFFDKSIRVDNRTTFLES